MPRYDNNGNELFKGESPRTQGGYMYRFTDTKGRRHSIYAESLETLRQKQKQFLSLEQMFQLWLAGKNLQNTGKAYYHTVFTTYIYTFFEDKPVFDIAIADIKTFQVKILNNSGISNERKVEVFQVCQSVFLWGARNGYISEDYTDLFQNRAWTKGRFHKADSQILEILKEELKIDYVLKPVYISILLKLPAEYVMGLTWQDIDLEKREITINKRVSYYDNPERKICVYSLERPVRVPFNEEIKKVLKDILFPMPERILSVPVDGFYGFIFVSKSGRLLTRKHINNSLRLMALRRDMSELYTWASLSFDNNK